MPKTLTSVVGGGLLGYPTGGTVTLTGGPPGLAGPNTISDATTVGTLTDLTGTAYSLLGRNAAGTGPGRIPLTATVRSLLGAADEGAARTAIGAGTPYTLPIASGVSLGGVRVGSGLAIDPGTGVLSASGGGAAAAGSLTGATLAANVLASSLTSVGTLTALSVGAGVASFGAGATRFRADGSLEFGVTLSGKDVNSARLGSRLFTGALDLVGINPTNAASSGDRVVQVYDVLQCGRFRGDASAGFLVFNRAAVSHGIFFGEDLDTGGTFFRGSGTVTFSGLVRLGTYTVATLPSASANAGAFAQVTDSNSTTNGATVTGGGSNRVPVFSNGANWIIK
jgi:hypothetical protein